MAKSRLYKSYELASHKTYSLWPSIVDLIAKIQYSLEVGLLSLAYIIGWSAYCLVV